MIRSPQLLHTSFGTRGLGLWMIQPVRFPLSHSYSSTKKHPHLFSGSPVCGPYTPGRKVLTPTAEFYDAVSSSVGYTWIGGDGLPSCDPSSQVQCHIPLTATITNPANGKSVSGVKIVDKCAGCSIAGSIDVTPAVFKELADPSVGRVSGIQWKFDRY